MAAQPPNQPPPFDFDAAWRQLLQPNGSVLYASHPPITVPPVFGPPWNPDGSPNQAWHTYWAVYRRYYTATPDAYPPGVRWPWPAGEAQPFPVPPAQMFGNPVLFNVIPDLAPLPNNPLPTDPPADTSDD